MYIVTKAYDDNTAEIIDIGPMTVYQLNTEELIQFSKRHDVLGLSVSRNKINYLQAYHCMSFATENEAREYMLENNLPVNSIKYTNGMVFVVEKIPKIHVNYYICYYEGNNATYVGDKGGYTPYIQAAKVFSRQEAGQRAAIMKQQSTTGKDWTTQRVIG